MTNDDFAIDGNGRPLPLTPQQVNATVQRMMDDGRLIAVLLQAKDGTLGLKVFGEPSREIADALMQGAEAYMHMFEEPT